MNRDDVLHSIAMTDGLDTTELIAYANEATDIGGYHDNPHEAKWPNGSMWAVEGQILYALIRATRPAVCIETGTNYGCSATHITAALDKNRKGKLICVDWSFERILIPLPLRERIEFRQTDIHDFIQNMPPFDFLLEDGSHDTDQVQAVWSAALKAANPGAFIVSHDAAHFNKTTQTGVGLRVTRGIINAGAHDTMVYEIEPSDCGLGVYRVLPRSGAVINDKPLIQPDITLPIQSDKEAVRKAENARKQRERRAAARKVKS